MPVVRPRFLEGDTAQLPEMEAPIGRNARFWAPTPVVTLQAGWRTDTFSRRSAFLVWRRTIRPVHQHSSGEEFQVIAWSWWRSHVSGHLTPVFEASAELIVSSGCAGQLAAASKRQNDFQGEGAWRTSMLAQCELT